LVNFINQSENWAKPVQGIKATGREPLQAT
jgi:hypothetical protein